MLTRTVRACLDPDGVLASERDHERRRHATLAVLPDGSGRLQAQLTGEATAVWQTILNTLARPVPDVDTGEPDRRSAGQRRHDALLDAGQRLLRAGTLPDAGGAPATVLITLDPGPGGGPHRSGDYRARRRHQRAAGAADRRRGRHRARRGR